MDGVVVVMATGCGSSCLCNIYSVYCHSVSVVWGLRSRDLGHDVICEADWAETFRTAHGKSLTISSQILVDCLS